MILDYELAENKKFISIHNTSVDKKIEYALGGSVSILNKFDFIVDLSKAISENNTIGNKYEEWLWKIMHDYSDAYDVDISENPDEIVDNGSKRYQLLIDNIDNIKYFVKEFYKESEIDFDSFANLKNMSKASIKFSVEDIKLILHVSSYMKIYCLIANSTKKALGLNLHRKIYNELISEFLETDVIEKIYNVVKTKTYKYNMSDKPMWEYLKNFQGKSIDSHIGETFNFLLNNIIVFCEYNKNPINFMVFVIDINSRWVLHSIYVHNIQYEGHLSTEDIHTITSDNLKTYAYNEVLGQLKTLSYHKISAVRSKELELIHPLTISIDDSNIISEEIINMNKRIEDIRIHSPVHHCLTFPMISQICDISYYHMKTIDANHACVISLYLHELLKEVFHDEYSNFFEILDYGVLKEPSVSTTFRIKYAEAYINKTNMYSFYGFKSKIILHRLICHFIGVMSRCKDGYMNLKTGEIRDGFSINNLELEVIDFFVKFCAGKFEDEITKIRKILFLSL